MWDHHICVFSGFLCPKYLRIIISLVAFEPQKKSWCHIEEDPERIRDPEFRSFQSRGIGIRIGIQLGTSVRY
jgi:hypothetical protein